jgi:Transposase domain (DUF772)
MMEQSFGTLQDLSPFYARYRQDGWGRAAYDPAMMVAIVLYAYAKGQRSSRGIERACVEDVAYRVIASNLAPDHVTINRFRSEHSDALSGPSTAPSVAVNHSMSPVVSSVTRSTSRRLKAPIPRLAISTFSADIAYPSRPTASRACCQLSKKRTSPIMPPRSASGST